MDAYPPPRKNHHRFAALLFAALVGLVSLCLPMTALASTDPPANGMGANDSPYTPSPAVIAYMNDKTAVVQQYHLYRNGKIAYSTYASAAQTFLQRYRLKGLTPSGTTIKPQTLAGPLANYSSNSLGVQQYTQAKFYYCGPASAEEILGYLGVVWGPDYPYESLTQNNLASSSNLKTDQNGGTNWGSGSSGVFAPTLNRWKGTNWYVQTQVYTPNLSSESAYESDMSSDIDYGWPLAAGIYEVNGSHTKLTGHPVSWSGSSPIQHWIAITGYSSYGGWTNYVDSIHGTNFWSWSSNVPASSSVSSSGTIWSLMTNGNYGIIW